MRVSDSPVGGDADRGAPVRTAARSSSPPPIARSVQSVSCAPSGESAAAGGPRSSMRPSPRLRNWFRWSPFWRSGRQRLYADYLVAKRANSLYEKCPTQRCLGRRQSRHRLLRKTPGKHRRLQLQKIRRATWPFTNLPEKSKGRWGLGLRLQSCNAGRN